MFDERNENETRERDPDAAAATSEDGGIVGVGEGEQLPSVETKASCAADGSETPPPTAEEPVHDVPGDEAAQPPKPKARPKRTGPIEEIVEDDQLTMDWYILKVQSNRENSICEGLQRRVAIAGLQKYFGEILVPTEDVAEFKNGKRRIVKRKLYPGYIVVQMAISDETWFLVRETPGIGDFTGASGKPTAMLPHEVDRIVKASKPDEESEEPIKTAIPFKGGDRVRITEGTFENFEGEVEGIDEANGRVTVMINIFGRSTPVELEHWQIENL